MPNWEYCAPMSHNVNLGVNLVDLNRDGLTDVIWSRYYTRYQAANYTYDGSPLIAQGVLLNTGRGWCSSIEQSPPTPMAAQVGAECPEADLYYPPENLGTLSYIEPSGFAFWEADYTGVSTGYLADLNADGYLDYVQAHTLKWHPGNKAWIFDPAGATATPRNPWVRDARFDLDIDYNLINAEFSDSVGFTVLDINGDGATDIVGDDLRSDGVEHPQAFISRSKHSDLLRLVRNGRGGELSIAYESAIVQRDATIDGLEAEAKSHAIFVNEALDEATDSTANADVIRWTSNPVVSEIRIAGPNRKPENAAASAFGPPTTYRYAHPRFCVKSRSDLGFRIVESTRPGGEAVTRSFYQAHGREFYERAYGRKHKYQPLIRAVFESRGIPEELAYMAFVESGFSPRARSHAGAYGLWQFIRSTGRRYGLRTSEDLHDVARSTEAAAEYLLDLIGIFGSRSFLLADENRLSVIHCLGVPRS